MGHDAAFSLILAWTWTTQCFLNTLALHEWTYTHSLLPVFEVVLVPKSSQLLKEMLNSEVGSRFGDERQSSSEEGGRISCGRAGAGLQHFATRPRGDSVGGTERNDRGDQLRDSDVQVQRNAGGIRGIQESLQPVPHRIPST